MSKQELVNKLFCEELFKQMLNGNVIGGSQNPKKMFKFKVIKQPLTQESIERVDELTFRDGEVGFHYTFDMGYTDEMRMVPTQEQQEKLKKLIKTTTKEFPICQ